MCLALGCGYRVSSRGAGLAHVGVSQGQPDRKGSTGDTDLCCEAQS